MPSLCVSPGDLLPVMCERAGFQQETSLILYEVIYLQSHSLWHIWFSLLQALHSPPTSYLTHKLLFDKLLWVCRWLHTECNLPVSRCVTGSKAQSNGAHTGLRCLSGQGPGWAHGWGHHCLPEVSLSAFVPYMCERNKSWCSIKKKCCNHQITKRMHIKHQLLLCIVWVITKYAR